VRRRVAIARNVLKVWLVLVVPAAAMGFGGWRLGGYRLTLLFAGSVVLLAAALYSYADRVAMGLIGARELLPGEAPALHSTVDRLAAVAGVARPRL
jgi:heat shock protein HtpX